jgi:hypothetical protein
MLFGTTFSDPPCVAGVAALFTLASARSIGRAAQAGREALLVEERRHTLAGAALGLWVAVCAAWPAFAWPAWMLSYADRLRTMPTLVWYPVFALGLMASGAAGAFFSFVCVARGNGRLVRLIAGGCFLVWFLLFAATAPRALVAGTWEQFEEGTAPSLAAQPRLLTVLVLLWALAAAGTALAFALRLRAERNS